MTDTATQDLIDTFAAMGDWEERYRLLIDMGRDLPPMNEALKTEGARVKGCVSNVWVLGGVKDGRFTFIADSDAHIVKGLVAVLWTVLNNRSPTEVLATDIEGIFAQLGLAQHLSPSRRNGFAAMTARLRALALMDKQG